MPDSGRRARAVGSIIRVITFGTGGLMSTLTVIGATPADVDAIDVGTVLGEAAKSFTELFSGGS